MKSVGSHGSSLLLFMMKVIVWHFVSKSHKVYVCTCCGDCLQYHRYLSDTWIDFFLPVMRLVLYMRTELSSLIEYSTSSWSLATGQMDTYTHGLNVCLTCH
jgi:hypothetical protein